LRKKRPASRRASRASRTFRADGAPSSEGSCIKETLKTAAKMKKKNSGNKKFLQEAGSIVKAALREDIGAGDITTSATVARGRKGTAIIRAKQDLVLAGSFLAEMVFTQLDRRIRFTPLEKDGAKVRKGRTLAEVKGPLAPILTGERVALNFLQRLSGIATLTRKFVETARPVKVLDTRKTTPCLRPLERYAVRMGGGHNHRAGLYDAVLIKDNHIEAAGGIKEAVRRVIRKYGDSIAVEVEAATLKEVKEALAGNADIIMLDNMDPLKAERAIKIINGRAVSEVSGGINLENISEYAATGVDFISIGALTHSAPAVDISMKVQKGHGPKKTR